MATKIVNQLSPSQAKQITTEVLSQAKNLKDYQNRDVHENEQAPIGFKIPDETFQPTMVNKKRAETRKQLERQLSKSKIQINKLKIQKTQ